VLGFAALSGIAIHGYASVSRSITGGNTTAGSSFTLDTNTIILFAVCLGVALVFSWAYVMLARLYPKQFIWVTGILNIAFALGTAIYYLYKKFWVAGIIFLVLAALVAWFFWSCRHRIPFSALLLKTSVNVARRYGHVWLLSFCGGVVAIALAAWFSVTLVAIWVRWQPDSQGRCLDGQSGCSNAKAVGLTVFASFAMFWMTEWLKNTLHAATAGVYGSWYYMVNNFPRDATRGALKRTLTYSFGSISFGSLIVAIINLLRQLCQVARNQDAASGDWIGCVMFCIADCLLGILNWIVEFVNRYAFVHVALYGKAYIAAAKDTWHMIKDRGFDALINDCLVGPVLTYGAMFMGYLCAIVAYAYLVITDPVYNQTGSYTAFIVAFAFLIGSQICNVFTAPIASGIETIFVAAAWDPEVMMRDHRDLYDEMVRVYPRVQESIHA
jgi:uncharacterized membrane protein